MRAAMITRYQQPLEIVNLADPKLPKDGIIMRVRCKRHTGVQTNAAIILKPHSERRFQHVSTIQGQVRSFSFNSALPHQTSVGA